MSISTVLTAIAISSIIFSFNGFQTPINLAGEVRNPGPNVAIGMIGSIIIAAVIYLLLQVAF
ncbi:amino acid permease [Pseudomonas sp. LTJR-52]|uniref:amino acid permease n=1 Tax=Pseudomonas sp. LTJR-52 TaxID=2479392 RepID=UPI001C497DEF